MSQHRFDYDIDQIYLTEDMSNKLFCTFSTGEELEATLENIVQKYRIIYNKIFVLYSKSQDEYICTYNVDFGNVSNFIDNTILVHRKKESNTLYTINALNELIKKLNVPILPYPKVDTIINDLEVKTQYGINDADTNYTDFKKVLEHSLSDGTNFYKKQTTKQEETLSKFI